MTSSSGAATLKGASAQAGMPAHVIRVTVREENPVDLVGLDADLREGSGENPFVGGGDAAVGQRARARGGIAEEVDPERRIGDLGVLGGDAECAGRNLE